MSGDGNRDRCADTPLSDLAADMPNLPVNHGDQARSFSGMLRISRHVRDASREQPEDFTRRGMRNFERVLWWLTLLWGEGLIWLAARPPLVDLPEHAGQVALLKGLLLGTSAWTDILSISPVTPYLLGYGLVLLFSFIMPIIAAVKLTISVAYLGFVFSTVKICRHFGCSYYLDWMLLPAFFGLSFVWGFFPFFVAAPVGLIFLLIAEQSVSKRTKHYNWLTFLIGLVLLISHGFLFAFFWSIAFVMIVLKCRVDGIGRSVKVLLPLIILAAIAMILFWLIIERDKQFGGHLTSQISLNYHWARAYELLTNSLDVSGGRINWEYFGIACVFLVAPWLMGLKLVHSTTAMVPLAMLLLVSALVPTELFGTWLLWERFSLFLFPAYAWIFSTRTAKDTAVWRTYCGVAVLILGCWFALGIRTLRIVDFNRESASISSILGKLAPAQKILYLSFDNGSIGDGHDHTYTHFASWYEAESGGFVIPSLAYYLQMVVRFRKGQKPKFANIERDPSTFNWIENQGDQYRYFVVRDKVPKSASVYFKGSLCLPQELFSDDEWQVYEKKGL